MSTLLDSQMTGEPSRHSVITVVVLHRTTTDYLPVTTVLLLETLLTGIVFAGFLVSSTQLLSIIAPSILVAAPIVLAPITGLGEQRVGSDRLWLIERSDYIDSWFLLLEDNIPSKIPPGFISYYDGNIRDLPSWE